MTGRDKPPVIVLGIDSPIGLSVVRELGRHGVEVHGIARNARGLGLYSRWLHRGYLRPSGTPELLALLNRIAHDEGAPFLMTVSMNDALAMRSAADQGRLHGLRPLLPELDRLELVNDKAAICAIADRIGIATPRTWEPDLDTVDTISANLSYPCVLKWRDPETVTAALDELDLPLLKTEYAHDAAALRRALDRYRPAGRFPLVQSYAPGSGLGQMFLMKDGKALLRFQHRRIHEWPPEGGTSTLCESVPLHAHSELLALSETLLREIAWEGPAMVEYRHDLRTGKSRLMEINGRFWGSLPLAFHSGAPFALGTYYALGLGQAIPEVPAYRAGLRCRYMIPETKRLAVVTLARGRIADRTLRFSPVRELLAFPVGFFRRGTRYFVFTFADPRPFLADMRFASRAALASLGVGARTFVNSRKRSPGRRR